MNPPATMGDFHQIQIRRLKVSTCIGVPEEERAVPQELRVSLEIDLLRDFAGMEDRIGETVDYAALAAGIQELAASRPRQLIETLASDIAGHVLAFPTVGRVGVTVEKFILPDTDCVAVRMSRSRGTI